MTEGRMPIISIDDCIMQGWYMSEHAASSGIFIPIKKNSIYKVYNGAFFTIKFIPSK